MATQQVKLPTVMYRLEPYYDLQESLQLSKTMYPLNSYYSSENNAPTDDNVSKEVADLERRQEAILQKLEQLKKEVEKLTAPCASTCPTQPLPVTQTTVAPTTCTESLGPGLQDIVVSADPTRPPLSLLVLQQMLSKHYKVLPVTHVHSSVSKVPDKLRNIFQQNGSVIDRSSYQVAFTLIWKQESHGPSMMVSPNRQTAIRGECSVARYLARLLQPAYDSGDIAAVTEVDTIVDLANQVLYGNNKEKAAVMRTLNSKLGKSAWLAGSELTLADIVVWSALLQTGQTQGIPGNVKKWLDNCNVHPDFQIALHCVL